MPRSPVGDNIRIEAQPAGPTTKKEKAEVRASGIEGVIHRVYGGRVSVAGGCRWVGMLFGDLEGAGEKGGGETGSSARCLERGVRRGFDDALSGEKEVGRRLGSFVSLSQGAL